MNLSLAFLRGVPAAIVTVILAIEGALFYLAPTKEVIPSPPPLRSFPSNVGPWKMQREFEIDPETVTFLKADDTLSRAYAGPGGPLTLFVGFFKSQRGGVTPHSPKICLPGAGWTPEESRIVTVSVPGIPSGAIPVNRYIVSHGEDRSLVLYWYVTAHYSMADEYYSKIVLMKEGLLHRRSDEAIFRVITPIAGDEAAAETRAMAFIREAYPPLRQQIWAQ